MSAEEKTVAPRRRRWGRWLLLALVVIIGLPLSLVTWLLFSESGGRSAAHWTARLTNDQVRVQGIRGRLAGTTEIEVVEVAFPAFQLRLEGLTLAWRPGALWERRVVVETLHARHIAMSSAPSEEESTTAPVMPGPLQLPVGLDLQRIAVDRFEMRAWQSEAEAPLFAIDQFHARIDSDGRVHHIRELEAGLPFGQATASGQLDTSDEYFPLQLKFGLDADFAPWAAVIDASLNGNLAQPQVLLNVRSGDMTAQLDAQAQPFEAVPVRSLKLKVQDLDPSLFQTGAPVAKLDVEAELTAKSTTDMVFAGQLKVDNRAPERLDQGGLPLQSLAAQLELAQTAITITALDARVLGEGQLQGSVAWVADEDPARLGRASADLVLQNVITSALDGRLPRALLKGRVEAAGTEQQQTARLDLNVDDAAIRADAQLSLAPETAPAFSAQGEVKQFDPAKLVVSAPQADINLNFDVKGVLAEPLTVQAEWQFAPSRVAGRPLTGRGQLAWNGTRLSDVAVALNLAKNTINANGAWGGAGDRLDLAIDAPDLAALQVGVAGQAKVNGFVAGSADKPAGQLSFEGNNIVAPGVRIRGLQGAGELSGGLTGPLKLDAEIRGVGAEQGPAADDWVEALQLSVQGQQDQHRATLALRTPQATDTLALDVSGALFELKPADAGLGWRGRIESLVTTGRFPLSLVAPAALEASAQRVVLSEARLDAGEKGRIHLAETVWGPEQISLRGGLNGLVIDLIERAPESTRRTRDPLTLAAEWDLSLGNRATGQARIYRESGDLVIPGELSTRLGLERLEARLSLRDQRAALSLDVAGPELGTLNGSATVLLEKTAAGQWTVDQDGRLLGSARLDMPSLAWVTRMMQEDIELGGALAGDFSFSGSPAEPIATGRIEGQDLAVALIEHGLQLSGGRLVAEFDRDQLKLTQLEFVSPNRIVPPDQRLPVAALTAEPGRLTASGNVQLESGAGQFQFAADRLPILQRSDRWMILSGQGQGESGWTHLNLQAKFGVDAGYIEFAESLPPSLSDDVVMVEAEAPAKEGGLKLTADVEVNLGEQLYLSALGLDTRLTGGLQIRMRDGQPLTATGSVATLGGRFQGYGQNLTIERGLVNFQGPLDNPGLNIVALRKGLPVEAGISVGGNARRPEVKLISNPDVPDPEKLSWIVLGRAPSAGSGGEMGVLGPAALALLGSSGMTEQLQSSLGLDEFGIGQGELGTTTRAQTSSVVGSGSVVKDEAAVSSQVLSVGKRLSQDMFLSFEQSLGGAESLIKLTYQLSRRLSFVARGGVDSSADLYYTVSFR